MSNKIMTKNVLNMYLFIILLNINYEVKHFYYDEKHKTQFKT